MNNKFLNIRSILDVGRWQTIQDELALVTKMAIITVDYKGVPITKHSKCSEFCKIIRSDPKTSKICQKCDARGGIEAVRINRNYIYKCHCNIIDAAIPIIIDDKYFGSVMVGQVLLKGDEEEQYIEKIYNTSDNILTDQNKMLYLYGKLPRLTYSQIKRIVNMIGHITNYIVEEAIRNLNLYEENENLKQYIKEYLNKKDLEMDLEDVVNREIKSDSHDSLNATNNLLIPAIDYIHENFDKKITLDEMANMCFISAGYFSKVFYRETGENFSNYLTKLRIHEAKRLLKTTDKNIQEISLEVGFNDVSYFTKRFKEYEGITPGLFRRHFQNKYAKYKIVSKLQNNTTL